METSLRDNEDKKELDDSGCVQDGPPLKQADGDKETRRAELLDLSDDVLLYILKHCSPRDLKALGYTCPRLGRLICDRTLWQRVDARSEPTGRARLRWLLAHALGANTTELLLTGYAREARGCLGHVDRKRKDIEDEIAMANKKKDAKNSSPSTSGPSPEGSSNSCVAPPPDDDALSGLQGMFAPPLSRSPAIAQWPEDDPAEVDPEECVLLDGSCSGPQFTLTQCMLRQLRSQCSLTSLALQHCNINCNTTGINHFPPTLTKLSLRGSKCYNLPLDKSFLFNIQDYLPQLEYLDLSECDWLEPASFLPLSKAQKLTHLIMRDCHRMAEFVAYASLATRYGFRKLKHLDARGTIVRNSEVAALSWLPSLEELWLSPAKHLDARGSPLGDSEVAALGWLPSLEELWLSPCKAAPPRTPDHSHCRDETLPPHTDLAPWELEEPEYFKIKPQLVEPMDTGAGTSIDDIEEHIEQLRHYENNICLHGLENNLCMEGIRRSSRNRPEQTPDVPNSSQTQKDDSNSSQTQKDDPNTSEAQKEDPNTSQAQKDVPNSSQEVMEQETDASQPSTSLKNDNPTLNGNKIHFNAKNLTKNLPQNNLSFMNVTSKSTSNESSKSSDNATPSTSYKDIIDKFLPSLKRTTAEDSDVPSKKSKKSNKKDDDSSDECYSSDDEVPLKKISQNLVNDGAGTSKEKPESPEKPKEDDKPDDNSKKKYELIRFRRNMDPVIVRRDADEVDEEERQRENRERERRERQRNERQDNVEARPRAHVLYVNIGQQLHSVYRLSVFNEPPSFLPYSRTIRMRPHGTGNVFYTPPRRLDATSLVTDSAIRRFGRADTDDVNVVFFGPRPQGNQGARPNRSNLVTLSVRGFRNITDRSLEHLATAAPNLRFVDFSESGVTAQGVENFKSLRPDCEVIFSPYVERDEQESA